MCACVCLGVTKGCWASGAGEWQLIVRESPMLNKSFSFPSLISPLSSSGLCLLQILEGNKCFLAAQDPKQLEGEKLEPGWVGWAKEKKKNESALWRILEACV